MTRFTRSSSSILITSSPLQPPTPLQVSRWEEGPISRLLSSAPRDHCERGSFLSPHDDRMRDEEARNVLHIQNALPLRVLAHTVAGDSGGFTDIPSTRASLESTADGRRANCCCTADGGSGLRASRKSKKLERQQPTSEGGSADGVSFF